jgi:hypothetical protein
MSITSKKGGIYSMEFLFSFLIAIIIAGIILSTFSSELNELISMQKEFDLKRRAFLLSEAIVKARNEETPVLGSAFFNQLKHRVESNRIDLELLSGIDSNSIEGLKELKIVFLDGKEINVIELRENEIKNNCIAVERFVLTSEITPRKAKLFLRLCDE